MDVVNQQQTKRHSDKEAVGWGNCDCDCDCGWVLIVQVLKLLVLCGATSRFEHSQQLRLICLSLPSWVAARQKLRLRIRLRFRLRLLDYLNTNLIWNWNGCRCYYH